MEFKYLVAQEKVEQLQRELELMKETQSGFKSPSFIRTLRLISTHPSLID